RIGAPATPSARRTARRAAAAAGGSRRDSASRSARRGGRSRRSAEEGAARGGCFDAMRAAATNVCRLRADRSSGPNELDPARELLVEAHGGLDAGDIVEADPVGVPGDGPDQHTTWLE